MKSVVVVLSKESVSSLCLYKNEDDQVTNTLNRAVQVHKDAHNCSIVTFSDQCMEEFYVTFTQRTALNRQETIDAMI